MQIEEARLLSRKIGFTHLIDVRENKSINQAVKKASKQLSCIYMHIRENGTIYIGKAKNITTRHQQHVQQGHPMSYLALFFCSAAKLDEKESELIDRAEKLNAVLANREKKTPSVLYDGSLRFDDLFSAERQLEFIEEAESLAFLPETQMQRVVECASQPHKESWALFKKRRDADDILRLGALYLAAALPSPEELEATFWLSTLVKFNNQNRRYPLLSITTGRGLGVEIFCFTRSTFAAFAEVRLAANVAAESEKALNELKNQFPWVSWNVLELDPFTPEELEKAEPFGPYKDREERLNDLAKPTTEAALRPPVKATMALSHFEGFIRQPVIAKAAAVYAISRMRQGVVMRPEHHNTIAGFALKTRLSCDVLD